MSPGGKILVFITRIHNISHQGHNMLVVLTPPGLVKLCRHRRGIDMIPIMVVVIVVKTRTKVLSRITERGAVGVGICAKPHAVLPFVITAAHDHSSPGAVIEEGRAGLG